MSEPTWNPAPCSFRVEWRVSRLLGFGFGRAFTDTQSWAVDIASAAIIEH